MTSPVQFHRQLHKVCLGRREGYQLVKAFLGSKTSSTRAAYSEDLAAFSSFLGAPTVDEAVRRLVNHGPGHANSLVLAFRDHLTALDYAPATVNRRLAAVKSLVLLGRMLEQIPFTIDVPGLRAEPYRDTRGPGICGVRAMLGILTGRADPKAIRDSAILRLLFDLGLRRAEVCSLDLEHLDLDAGIAWVLGKGKRQRVGLTIPAPTSEALVEWLSVRGSDPGPVFTNFDRAGKGCRLTGQSVYRIVLELGREAGLERPVRPHGIRHAAITAALDATGGDVRSVQRFSRHVKIDTVAQYDDNRRDLGGQVAHLVAAGLSAPTETAVSGGS